ncbi:hypothetical protein [Virgibacillus sp. SK37]|uniref:hypothetical protein n=1 Tax=Virgibacillus sp. SK37 TaxID=403957 RepID=UPI0004D1BFCC|nr:hypothetical protein [Virgibacillus sp. SK37]AIF45569.1 hypothetical protein X953_16485 [Virgibacillus sp. SK37]
MGKKIINTFIFITPVVLSIISPIFQGPSKTTFPANYVFAGFILFSMGAIYWVKQYLNEKNGKINELEKVIERGYLSLTSEYNELSQFRYKKIQEETLKIFVQQKEYVPAVQVYEYSVSKTSPLKTVVKLNYRQGVIDEDEEINALIKAKYIYDKGELRRLERAIQKPKPKKLVKYIYRWRNELDMLSKTNITEKDVMKFSLLQVAIDYSSRMAQSTTKGYLNSESMEKELHSYKRTGIARAIISHDFFTDPDPYHFSYTGSLSRKTNRIYTCMIRKGKDGVNHLYLLTLQIDEGISKTDFNKIVTDTEWQFETLLRERKLLYNKVEGGSSGGL